MFIDNLSSAVLKYCEDNSLSQEKVAERCNLSTQCMGNIIRKNVSPNMTSFEKICDGLNMTPDELLLSSETQEQLSYRIPKEVIDARLYRDIAFSADTYFSICPKCNTTLERDYQNFCDRCGQRLSWNLYPDKINIK